VGDFNSKFNHAVWFDIPVADLDRAAAFYTAVLGVGIRKETYDDFSFCVIDHRDGNGGCLVKDEAEIGAGGVLIYLNVESRIRDAVSKVVPHGGSIVKPIHSISPHGFRAVILDSEGNRVALHSNSDA
jgi:predicted enzyme related to lactoylglutathione lyase